MGPETHRGREYNPAFVHPDDLADLGLCSGDAVTITSRSASIPAVVEADRTLRRGLVSMSHGYGDAPDRDHPVSAGQLAQLFHLDLTPTKTRRLHRQIPRRIVQRA
jgi:anaerobic selenocysteine-containing dehydrogenase